MKKNSIILSLMLLLLFLFSLSFLNLTGYIYSIIILIYLMTNNNKKVDVNFIIIILFSIFYFINYSLNFGITAQSVIIYLLSPWSSYLISKTLVEKNNNKVYFYILYALMLGFFAHGILNLNTYLNIYGLNYNWRISYDFWRKEISSVTCNGLYFTPIFSYSVGYLFFGESKKNRLFCILAIILSIYASIIYRNRTLILIGIILVCISSGIILLSKNEKNIYKKIKLIIISLFVIFSFFALNGNLYISNLDVFKRMTSDNDSTRLQLWIDFLKKNPFKYLIGGQNLYLKADWVHNMWLDVLYKVGLLPFITLTYFSLKTLVADIKLIYNSIKINSNKYRCYYILFIGEFINCMVEPVIDANPYIFIFFIILSGFILNLYKKKKME